MKKWSFVVAALYGLLLAALFIPVAAIACMKKWEVDMKWPAEALLHWEFWSIITVLAIAQFALLRIPVEMAHRRPVKQRSLWTTVITAALMMGLLVFGAGASLWECISIITKIEGWDNCLWLVIALALTSWGGWAIYFYRSTQTAAPEMQMSRMKRHLWTGSILELLVAVPTHILVRQRDICCAGFHTFLGLTCGISVMLFAFGPAVYFLFVERWKRLHPKD
jgi:hypothetical protein